MPEFCPQCGCEYGKEGSHDKNVAVCPTTRLPLAESQTKPGVYSCVDWSLLFIAALIQFIIFFFVLGVILFPITLMNHEKFAHFDPPASFEQLVFYTFLFVLGGSLLGIIIYLPILSNGCRKTMFGIREGWNVCLMIFLCFISLCPLFGWIYGGINMSKTHHSEGRKKQALVLIIISSVSFVLTIVFTMFFMHLGVVAGK